MIKKIGIVGTGDIATQFISQLDLNKYQVVAVYNRNPESLSRFLEMHQLEKGYESYPDFLKSGDMDCVYIATPNQTHYGFILEALEANKHVLCEKVMVLKGEQVDYLYKVAAQNKLVLLEAVTLFYMPLYQEISQLLDANTLGKISGASITFGSCKEFDPENRFFSFQKGGGALFDIGTYALSAAVYLLGLELEVVSTEVVMAPTGVDEKSVTILKNSDNQLVSVMISFRGKMPKQIILTGDKGYLVVDDFPRAENGRITFNSGDYQTLSFGDERDVFTYELDTMNQFVQGTYDKDIRLVSQKVIHLMDDIRRSWGWEI